MVFGGSYHSVALVPRFELVPEFRSCPLRLALPAYNAPSFLERAAVYAFLLVQWPGAVTVAQNREVPVLTEYRGLLGGIFKRMYSLDNERIARVFPTTVPLELGLL